MNKYVPIFQEYSSPDLYDLAALTERAGVLELDLVDGAQRRLRLSFLGYLGYRKANESNALKSLADIAKTSQAGRSFYRVEDSEYLRWFVDQSYGIRRPESLTHVAVVTIDDIVDVITVEMPSIQAL